MLEIYKHSLCILSGDLSQTNYNLLSWKKNLFNLFTFNFFYILRKKPDLELVKPSGRQSYTARIHVHMAAFYPVPKFHSEVTLYKFLPISPVITCSIHLCHSQFFECFLKTLVSRFCILVSPGTPTHGSLLSLKIFSVLFFVYLFCFIYSKGRVTDSERSSI